MKQIFVAVLLALALYNGVSADSVRTNVAAVVTLDISRPEGTTVDIRYNDAVALILPPETFFVQALELELRIPRAFSGQEQSVEWSVYSDIEPSPETTRYDYIGQLLMYQVLPARVSLVVQLPVSTDHTLRPSQFAQLVPVILAPDRFPLLFKLSPIGKGFSANIENEKFRLTIRPLLNNKGVLRVRHPFAASSLPIRVFLDDTEILNWETPQVLSKGVYSVRISAEGYRDEVYSIVVESGKTVTVQASPVSDAPAVLVQAPEGTQVRIDGILLDTTATPVFAIQPGEHTVECTIGDYTIIRKFNAVRGKTYTVQLSVDMQILTQ